METFNSLINAFLQILVFTTIPFIWWLIKGRKQESFFKWIGIKPIIIDDKRKYLRTFITAFVMIVLSGFILVRYIDTSIMATSKFTGKGMSVLFGALIYSFLTTGLAEEVFFRGFLTKRLINKFDFPIGNALQALVFGLLHGLMFITFTGWFIGIVITGFTGIAGWLMGWLNERQSGGSILSSWLLHGLTNTVTSFMVMYNLL